MRNEQALHLLFSLSDDSPLIKRIRREHFPEAEKLLQEHRLWYGNRDAALGSHLTFTYFRERRKLPKEIGWSAMRRAYRCLEAPAESRRTDPVCHEVLSFGHPANMRAQAILNGYLCCKLSYEEIARRFGRSVEFVRLYAELFCDFVERRESSEFVDGVLDPQGDRGCFQTDLSDLLRIAEHSLRLMNIGFWYGPDVLAAAIGRVFDGATLPSEAELLKNARRWLLIRAQPKSMNGSLDSKDPAFGLIKALSQQQNEESDSGSQTTQLETLSMSEGVQLTLNAILQEQISGQLGALGGLSNPGAEGQAARQGSNYEI